MRSFAQGQCVKDKFYINNLLLKKFENNVKIYNLSSAGNNPAINSSVLSGFTDIIQPNIVIIILFSNDQLDRSTIFLSQSKKQLKKYFKFINNEPFISDEVMTLLNSEKYISELSRDNQVFHCFFQKLKNIILEFSRKQLYNLYLNIFFKFPDATKFFYRFSL